MTSACFSGDRVRSAMMISISVIPSSFVRAGQAALKMPRTQSGAGAGERGLVQRGKSYNSRVGRQTLKVHCKMRMFLAKYMQRSWLDEFYRRGEGTTAQKSTDIAGNWGEMQRIGKYGFQVYFRHGETAGGSRWSNSGCAAGQRRGTGGKNCGRRRPH